MIEGLLTTEFLSLVGGSVTGFIFKSLAEKRQNEQERFNRILEANKASNESHMLVKWFDDSLFFVFYSEQSSHRSYCPSSLFLL
jgi:hypothetical protein